jgi:hypothetical protein
VGGVIRLLSIGLAAFAPRQVLPAIRHPHVASTARLPANAVRRGSATGCVTRFFRQGLPLSQCQRAWLSMATTWSQADRTEERRPKRDSSDAALRLTSMVGCPTGLALIDAMNFAWRALQRLVAGTCHRPARWMGDPAQRESAATRSSAVPNPWSEIENGAAAPPSAVALTFKVVPARRATARHDQGRITYAELFSGKTMLGCFPTTSSRFS